jgi:hypothetical protein
MMKPNLSLYQIQAHYLQLLDKDEYSREDLELLNDLPGLLEDKLIQRAYVVKNLEYMIASINCELDHMKQRRNKLEKNLKGLQDSIIDNMHTANIAKITKCPHFEIAVHKKKPRVDDYDKHAIPEHYWTVDHKPVLKLNKDLLHDDLAAGMDIPGARLVDLARLVIK